MFNSYDNNINFNKLPVYSAFLACETYFSLLYMQIENELTLEEILAQPITSLDRSIQVF